MKAEYILRLDDACPTGDARRWKSVEAALRSRSIRPIVAIVPSNEDPALVRGPTDGGFWDRARAWAEAGWMIALHGYSHALRASPGGLVPVNRRSEFVGLPLAEQRRRIGAGLKVLNEHGLSPEAWVAPAHGMDRGTLDALRSESDIRIVSDSFVTRPVRRWGFVWIPQQLWRQRSMPFGLWSICLHPNEMDPAGLRRLALFIDRHRDAISDPRIQARQAAAYGPADLLCETIFLSALRLRRTLGKGKHHDGT